jgi:hypothetical protein
MSCPSACVWELGAGGWWGGRGCGRVLGHPRATGGGMGWAAREVARAPLPIPRHDSTHRSGRMGGSKGLGGQSVLPNAQSWAGVVSGRKGSVLARGASMGGPQS